MRQLRRVRPQEGESYYWGVAVMVVCVAVLGLVLLVAVVLVARSVL